MSLPSAWVDRIFSKLTVTYGRPFLDRWRDLDLDAVKADWAHELSAFQQSPARISFALENLPEKPPSVVEFKNLCTQLRMPDAPTLPGPAADPQRVAAELARLAPMRAAPAVQSGYDCKAWAKVILRQHDAGARSTPTVVSMARRALGMDAA